MEKNIDECDFGHPGYGVSLFNIKEGEQHDHCSAALSSVFSKFSAYRCTSGHGGHHQSPLAEGNVPLQLQL